MKWVARMWQTTDDLRVNHPKQKVWQGFPSSLFSTSGEEEGQHLGLSPQPASLMGKSMATNYYEWVREKTFTTGKHDGNGFADGNE